MNRKVYFAGSIRGGRSDATLYHELIQFINTTDTVLTEQVGNLSRSIKEQTRSKDALIYQQDTKWLQSCDLVLAECTTPSLGVGYELAYAEAHNKPVYILYRPEDTQLSAMLTGNHFFHIIPYKSKEELFGIVANILNSL